MIGKIIIGKYFRGCISYCLENKKQNLENKPVLKKRAEVLTYNLCYGDKSELIKQFNEVRNLNPKLSKPVMHITLSLAPGEFLQKGKLTSLVEQCAIDLGFEKNQFIAIAHNDTGHQHLHIVVNRTGFDGRTVKDSHNYQKIAAYCRRMELQFGLQQVLSPRRYLTKEERNIPRLDTRKELLQKNIRECLSIAKNYQEFERQMKQKHYEVLKARGIAFIDPQKVRVKGSEVGYSLTQIEKILLLDTSLKKTVLRRDEEKQNKKTLHPLQQRLKIQQTQAEKYTEKNQSLKTIDDLLLKPPVYEEHINPALLKKKRQKKKGLHL